jgi:hypothetical protein
MSVRSGKVGRKSSGRCGDFRKQKAGHSCCATYTHVIMFVQNDLVFEKKKANPVEVLTTSKLLHECL